MLSSNLEEGLLRSQASILWLEGPEELPALLGKDSMTLPRVGTLAPPELFGSDGDQVVLICSKWLPLTAFPLFRLRKQKAGKETLTWLCWIPVLAGHVKSLEVSILILAIKAGRCSLHKLCNEKKASIVHALGNFLQRMKPFNSQHFKCFNL